jgi:uncharacterized protein with GYD domain
MSCLTIVRFLRQRIRLSDNELFSPLKAACLLYMHDFLSILADGPFNFYIYRRVSIDRCYSSSSSLLLRVMELQLEKEALRMALYMVQATYTSEALATLAKNPQDRSVPVRELVQKLGGRLVGFYFCYGEYDIVGLSELPDDSAATALALAVASAGHLKAFKTTKLFTAEETIEAMRKAGSITFQAPSKG